MRSVIAIFNKQLSDLPKNMSVTLMFIMYPILAWILVNFMGDGDPSLMLGIAMMSVGSLPLVAIANTIAEDNEYKSLRFLVMAGVKPSQYLAGLAIFTLALCLLPMIAFGLIGQMAGMDLVVFVALCMLGCVASLILGAVVGLYSKNVQQGSVYYTILMLLVGFVPMIAMFNPDIVGVTYFLFTQQIFFVIFRLLIGYYEADAALYEIFGVEVNYVGSSIVIAANIVVFLILFIILYKKKGLKG